MKLQYKITLFVTIILILVISSIGALSFIEMENTLKTQMGKNALDIARAVAAIETVKDNVGTPNGHLKIQPLIEKLRLQSRVQFIVVMDMKSIRYSHPVPENIGMEFQGGDEKRVLAAGEEYVSEAAGTLGPSLRAFVPIYKEGEQVGAVAVGILKGWAYQEIQSVTYKFIPFLLTGLLIGIAGGAFLSWNIKKTLFGLEPGEIAWLLSEREAVLRSINEGIVAIDKKGRITLFNQTAQDILGLKNGDIGRHVNELSCGKYMAEMLKENQHVYNKEIKIRPGVTVLCNYHPLLNSKNEPEGVVANFQDLTDVKHMAEELTGIKKMTSALRAQNHEFMNKLHTISGLIQLGEYDHAIQFISQTAETRQEVLGILTHRIKDISIAGLLLAKYNKASEDRVTLEIHEESMIDKVPQGVTSDELVSVLGNLIDNSLEAVIGQENGKISVKIYEENNHLNIEVTDNGPGIDLDIRDRIFEGGVSTKEGQRGYGLFIVKKIVDDAKGSIYFSVDDGTRWFISLPM